jgi:hypothetical protein
VPYVGPREEGLVAGSSHRIHNDQLCCSGWGEIGGEEGGATTLVREEEKRVRRALVVVKGGGGAGGEDVEGSDRREGSCDL